MLDYWVNYVSQIERPEGTQGMQAAGGSVPNPGAGAGIDGKIGFLIVVTTNTISVVVTVATPRSKMRFWRKI